MLELIDGRDQLTPVRIPRPRPVARATAVEVAAMLARVRLEGDAALVELAERSAGIRLDASRLTVDPRDLVTARARVPGAIVDALEVLAERLRATCEHQVIPAWSERRPGELAGELARPLARVGVCLPPEHRRRASSVLAAAIPARAAGVASVVVACPPDERGQVDEAVLAACSLAGVSEVHRVGGPEAVAALAYGTGTIHPVDKIVGPENDEVTEAKRLVAGWVGVDSPRARDELALLADGSSDPNLVAADMVAHAELVSHGALALITWVPEVLEHATTALELHVAAHADADQIEVALIEGGCAVLVRDLEHALDTVNAFAPARLGLAINGAEQAVGRIRNAGAVFMGSSTPISAGDHLAGIGGPLPSGGSARWASGLTARDFVKTIYVSGLEPDALARLALHAGALAGAEDLPGHLRALEARVHDSPETR